jgi:hypothetical protein
MSMLLRRMYREVCEYSFQYVIVGPTVVGFRGWSAVFLVSHRTFRARCTVLFLALSIEKEDLEVG